MEEKDAIEAEEQTRRTIQHVLDSPDLGSSYSCRSRREGLAWMKGRDGRRWLLSEQAQRSAGGEASRESL